MILHLAVSPPKPPVCISDSERIRTDSPQTTSAATKPNRRFHQTRDTDFRLW